MICYMCEKKQASLSLTRLEVSTTLSCEVFLCKNCAWKVETIVTDEDYNEKQNPLSDILMNKVSVKKKKSKKIAFVKYE